MFDYLERINIEWVYSKNILGKLIYLKRKLFNWEINLQWFGVVSMIKGEFCGKILGWQAELDIESFAVANSIRYWVVLEVWQF